jgi:aminopeptidase N
VNVTEAGLTWIKQTGFPVIKLSVRADRTTVDITQKMFLEFPDKPLKEYYPSPYGYIQQLS